MNRFVSKVLFLLALDLVSFCHGAMSCARAQSAVRVSAARQVVLPVGYEQLLAKLEGEETTRAMFRSQHLELLTYTPRSEPETAESHAGNASEDAAEHAAEHAEANEQAADTATTTQGELEEDVDDNEDSVRALIDSTACSAEFGWMVYITTIVANEEQTTIDVELVCPAGMLLSDHYRFLITPVSSEQTSLSITHSLDVRLMKRRFEIVNQLIRQITCREASAQVQQLTQAMEQCLVRIASSAVQTSTTTSGDELDDEIHSAVAEVVQQDDESEQDTVEQNTGGDVSPARQENAAAATATNSASTSGSEQASELPKLVVRMKVGKSGKGSVRLAIFDSESQFRKFDARKEEKKQGEAFRKQEVQVGGEAMVECIFDDVPPGNYVIAAFQDIDGNKKLNASFLGLPSEPYGFSRDARGQLGAPNYEDAEIKFDAEHAAHEFLLR